MTDPPLDHPLGPASMPPSDLAQLLALATGAPVDPDVIHLLWHLDPTAVPPVTLLHATVLCRRLVSALEAVEQSVVAALARPGVAVPLARVVDAARWSAAKPGELAAPDAVLDRTMDPVTDPRCAAAVAQHAARFAAMEIGAALHLSPLTARIRVERALHIVDAMPRTLGAMRTGELDGLRASILADATSVLTPTVRAAVEAEVIGTAGSYTPSRLRAVVARTILRLDPNGAADRVNAARTRRDVYSRPQPDDLATVTAIMGADKAATMMWLLNTMADACCGVDDPRGVGERRTDALTDIVDDLITTGVADIRPLIRSRPTAVTIRFASSGSGSGSDGSGSDVPGWLGRIGVGPIEHS